MNPEKFIQQVEEINPEPRYDMKANQLKTLAEAARGRFEAVILGFRLGYRQGSRAATKALRRKSAAEPKSRKEYRDAIAWNVARVSGNLGLKLLSEISQMVYQFYRSESATWTQAEYHRLFVLEEILNLTSERSLALLYHIAESLNEKERKEWQDENLTSGAQRDL